MTRINAGIDPSELCDQMLVAETAKELPRVYGLVVRRIEGKRHFLDLPSTFRLNTGHVKFFYDKGEYLRKRWESLRDEMFFRGFACNNGWRAWPKRYKGFDLRNDWDDSSARDLLQERILHNMIYTMKEEPRWTKRTAPDWVQGVAI